MAQLTAYLEDVQAFCQNHRIVCGGIVAAVGGIALMKMVKRQKALNKRKAYPRDTVVLHQVGRGPYAPSLVPFAVKLETYLRMAKIPYQNDHSLQKSSKQKYPWITYNGEDIADSAFCIDFLNKTRHVNLNSWLTAEQSATAKAFQRLAEESLYWVLVVTRWVNEMNEDFTRKAMGSVLPAKLLLIPGVRRKSWAQGIGRHSPEEVRQIAAKDLTALSNFLGRKKFLMGNQPCEEDCAVFGILSQLYWQMPSTISTMITGEFPQLVAYCERMKETFWPDWVECTTQGATAKATG